MPRFSANISMLFGEVELPERFEAAARAGFKAVEIQFPYGWSQRQLAEIARHTGVELVLINLPAGDAQKGDRGIACLPARVAEFRERLDTGEAGLFGNARIVWTYPWPIPSFFGQIARGQIKNFARHIRAIPLS